MCTHELRTTNVLGPGSNFGQGKWLTAKDVVYFFHRVDKLERVPAVSWDVYTQHQVMAYVQG